jgi:hypothetical protein
MDERSDMCWCVGPGTQEHKPGGLKPGEATQAEMEFDVV